MIRTGLGRHAPPIVGEAGVGAGHVERRRLVRADADTWPWSLGQPVDAERRGGVAHRSRSDHLGEGDECSVDRVHRGLDQVDLAVAPVREVLHRLRVVDRGREVLGRRVDDLVGHIALVERSGEHEGLERRPGLPAGATATGAQGEVDRRGIEVAASYECGHQAGPHVDDSNCGFGRDVGREVSEYCDLRRLLESGIRARSRYAVRRCRAGRGPYPARRAGSDARSPGSRGSALRWGGGL